MFLSGQDRYRLSSGRPRLSQTATKALLLAGVGASLAWMSGLAYLAGRLVVRGMTLL